MKKVDELSFTKYKQEGFILTYTLENKTFEIFDMEQTFQTLKIVNIWMSSSSRGRLDISDVP